MKSLDIFSFSVALIAAVSATSCGAGGGPADAVTGEASALTRTLYASWSDWSGTVTVSLYACGWSDDAQNTCGEPVDAHHPHACCTVPATDVVVGGGAEIAGDGTPGALVTESYPLDMHTWMAGSKDHVQPFPHRIRARVLGLRLAGVSRASLESQMKIIEAPGLPGHGSFVRAPLDSTVTQRCAGGGAKITYSGAGHLLDTSTPTPTSGPLHVVGWTAQSDDNQVADTTGFVTAYAIQIPHCPTGFSGDCLDTDYVFSDAPNAPGYAISILNSHVGWGYAATSVGGQANFNGAGRFLTDLYPYLGGTSTASARATSKDHGISDSSMTTRALMVGLRATP